ncbi:MAG: thiamine phosphate synthase [Methanomassiliicoccales archaeon]|jgi:thiamine-phosphate pyrophosphorylase
MIGDLNLKIFTHPCLYLVTEEDVSNGRSTVEVSKEAIKGGIDVLQMREKRKSYGERSILGRELSRSCKEQGVLFIVNDDPILAKEVDADGVHLGQEDIEEWTLERTRNIIGRDRIIGLSTHSIEQVRQANSFDVDYIAFGPVFPTQTKDYYIGTEDVSTVLRLATKPIVLIGGITLDNVDVLLEKGAENIAVIRAITQAENIASRVQELKERIVGNGAKMMIRVNGKEESVEIGSTLQDLVTHKGFKIDHIVVEHNSNLVPPEEWGSTDIKYNDVIEIISFVGGG